MKIQKIHENWEMRCVGGKQRFKATVPGSVYSDLIKNGVMDDPFYRDNENNALKLMENDYEYSTEFTADDALWKESYIVLCFQGLDTIANIWLNGVHIGYADNMHRKWEYEVKGILKKGVNELKVLFHSPLKYIREKEEKDPWLTSREAIKGASHIRKAQCMFGWDWGPRLPDAGIFRPVYLKGYKAERFDTVNIRQEHGNGCVYLSFDADVKCFDYKYLLRFGEDAGELNERKLDCRIEIINPEGRSIAEKVIRGSEEYIEPVIIDNPKLWWPNGLGSQPLYTVKATLIKNGEVLDVFKKRIGLRTLTVAREKDKYGESFAFTVNGVKYFAMGADYIPEDNILSRVTAERTRKLLEKAVAAHHNTIRVWGGGYYPDDFFFDACDELGIVVWIDFMFACGVYCISDEEFEKNVAEEFVQNIKRIRNHASLGLWCGNNEIEGFADQYFAGNKKFGADYTKLYEYILPKLVKKYDPQTFYWPSSPSSGGAFDEPNSPDRGDTHYWEVWHGNKPFTEYRKYYFRFLSEFGFQSFPSVKTIESFTEPGDRNVFSYVMEKHQRNTAANGKIMNYMEQTYLYPTSFDSLVYASQLLQADAIRYGVEHFRRNRGRCMGTVVWQLNDCWPVTSWASIDYYGRWKALHYYEKRFFAPLMISCEEESLLTQDPNPNAEPYELKKSIRLCACNESMEDEQVIVYWEIRNIRAEVLKSFHTTIDLPKLSSVWLDKMELNELDEKGEYVSYRMEKNGEVVSSGTVIFTVPKFFRFVDPELTVRLDGDEIEVKASSFAKSVEIQNGEDNLILSDNFFDMNGGEKRVKVISGKPESLSVRSVYDIK